MTKSGREIMEIFEAFDLTGTAWSAAQLTGCDAKTVTRYVAVRDAGGDPLARAVRPRLIDGFMPKIEELVDRSKGKIRADVALCLPKIPSAQVKRHVDIRGGCLRGGHACGCGGGCRRPSEGSVTAARAAAGRWQS